MASVQLIGVMRNELLEAEGIHAEAFSSDSKLVATVGAAGFTQLWDSSTVRPYGPSLHHKHVVRAVQFRGRNDVVTGGADGLKFYSAGKKQPPQTIQGLGVILALDYSPDLKLLATGSNDGNVRIFSGKAIQRTFRHNGRVLAVAFRRDGKRLLTGSDDQTARLWDIESGHALGMPYSLPCGVPEVAFSADGKTILTHGPGKIVRLWHTPGPNAIRPPLPQNQSGIPAVAYSRDRKRILAAYGLAIPRLRVWDAETGEIVGEARDLEKPLTSVAFHPDGAVFLTGSADKTARLWDAKTMKEIGRPCPHKATVQGVAFRPDGKAFVTLAHQTTQLWDTATQKPLGKPMNCKRRILAPNGICGSNG